jgi:hypothetical protein
MALAQSPKIVTDGLQFYYDMANPQKSWRGKPMTNYISNPTEEMARGEFGQYRDLAPTFNTYGLVPYSLSMDIKTNKNGSVLVYMQNGSSTKYSFVSSSVNATTEWQRFYFNNLTPAISTPSDIAATLATYTGYGSGVTPTVRNIQLELGSYATSFVDGSRSNTQSILDLTGTNTATAASLVYETDNTFSFNGSNNYIDVSGAGFASGMSAYTISHWSRRDIESRMPVAGRTSTAFYQYGDNSWAYTHGGVWGEYYYPRAASIPLGTWGHYCIVYDGAYVKIYRNAYFEGQQATTGTADWSQGMRIGYWSAGGGYAYSGRIGSVNFYNRALSASEVQQNFNAHRGRYGL